jgi:aminomethyltransferase
VRLHPGDRLEVVNRDGGQVAELTVLDGEGGEGPAAIGARADGDATVLRDLVRAGSLNGDGFLAELHARGLLPDEARALCLFDSETPPGTVESFTVERDATAIVAAPGGRIVDGAWPASPLLIEIRRAVPRTPEEVELPPPLAEPRLDFRIDRATAAGYEVEAGEYIQVIDVQGKQCSDFLAFNRQKLERGVERGLDATTTRTLMGSAYPQPGLYRKSFDGDMDPLVEVVQDTVGRHDSFALACTAKYYADLGYPGHISCSENFNGQVTPYGVAPRKGWEALNFFYNTGFDADHTLIADEPWSRPGDYVLLRASNDLLCSSSACPDDIDPANGWDITDIHVRVYRPENRFSLAIAHRVTPEAEPVMTKETAFHPRISELTRDLVEYRGYWLPDCFAGEGSIAEYWACRERAAIMDLSPLRKWEVLGPDAELLMQRAITRDARKLSVGQVTYTAVCNETGGMLDDATVYRLGDDNFRFVTGDEYTGVHLRKLAEAESLRAWVKQSTDQLHNLAVQGPASREILKRVVWTPPAQPALEELKWFRLLIGRIGDYDGIPIVVSRTGYTGELGYEVWCHPDDGPAVWDAIWEAGEGDGLKPLGLSALDMLRIESGLIFAGYEFDDQVDPFEAGIGFAVALEGDDDFVGKEALIERKAHPQRTLVGLELAGQETAGHGDCVHVPGERSDIGVITSGTRSPILRKNIALCRMAVQYAEQGTAVEVGKLDGHQKRIPATVVRIPFYDPEKTRPRS